MIFTFDMILQAHMGVKGMVLDSNSGKGIPNALVQVKNITRISKGSRMNVDIDHDITSGKEIADQNR